MTYDYLSEETNDILAYIHDELNLEEFDTIEELEEYLNENLWTVDGVTGNASGSYTFSTWQAEEYIAHNMDLLEEACEEFGRDMGEAVKNGAEYCDVTIRCYLLSQAIGNALDEIEDEFSAAHEEEGE